MTRLRTCSPRTSLGPFAAPRVLTAALLFAGACGSSARPSTNDGGKNADAISNRDQTSADLNPSEASVDVNPSDSVVDVNPSDGGDVDPSDGGADETASDAGGDATRDAADAGSVRALDLNDVTILAPLAAAGAAPVLLRGSDLADDGTALVPRVLFDRLVANDVMGGSPLLGPDRYATLQLIAVRFDLCDRHLPGACPVAEDARMRLVFQPIFVGGTVEDVGFHAFYAIRNDELGAAVAALRDLAKLAPPSQSGALKVSPALSAPHPEDYAMKVRAFVRRFGGGRLMRLTMNAQPETSAQVRWTLRGVEKVAPSGDTFVDIKIAGTTALSEAVIFAGSSSFTVVPVADTPPGLLGALTQQTFDVADSATKVAYLTALSAVENPMTHTAETVPCVACHVSTFVMRERSFSMSSIDPLTLPGRYTSKFDLSTAGGSSTTRSVTRALGYIGMTPLISQRVVNETAQVLSEIEQRYPAP